MPEMLYRDALREALDEEMARDERVFILGEEVGEYNGAYKVTRGLMDKYGARRVMDTPITEESFTGVGIGAATAGLRPVVEWMTFNFAFQAMDQIVNNAAALRYMSGGQIKIPIVFRGPNGPAEYLGTQHSHSCATWYAHTAGLKVVSAATPYDAKGLLKSAIRDDNPVVMLEGELMYNWKGEVPDEEYLVPIGQADVKRDGKDVTVITYGRPLRIVMEAADELEEDGVDMEVVDLRSIKPLDIATIVRSVEKTNRCVIVDEAWPMMSVASYVAWLVSHRCFDRLDAQVELVCSEDVPMPYNHRLELHAQPSVDRVIDAVEKVLYMQ